MEARNMTADENPKTAKSCLTHPAPSLLEVGMDETQEIAFFDYLAAREAALSAAVGNFITDNVPEDRLRIIVDTTTNEIIVLAARIALHQRGFDV